ncbi:MAG: LysR family transcriptional regulator [Myxococcota bacterium]
MHPAEDFDVFVAIADAGSISKAARQLGVPRATLSRQLVRLEERLGVRLLHRSTRSLLPTQAGEALYPRARGLIDAANAAVSAVRRLDDTPRGRLRVSSAPLHSPAVGSLIAEFVAMHPEVSVELQTTTRHIDLAAEQIDLAIRGGVVRDPNLIARRLLRSEMLAVASPDYLLKRGEPTSASELDQHACLLGYQGRGRPVTAWPLLDGGKVRVDGPLVSNDLMALCGAAIQGLGIALLPRDFVQNDLRAGVLVEILNGLVGLKVSLSLVWLERQFLEPKVRAFVELATEWAKDGRLESRSDSR